MVKSLGWAFRGVGSVVVVGLLGLVGCGEDLKLSRLVGELNNRDDFPGTSIAANNLAQDGAGLSGGGVDVDAVRVVWCCDTPDSDGVDASTGEAMVLFTAVDAATGTNRVFATHYLNGTLVPPVELQADDRDAGGVVDLDAAVAVCLTVVDPPNAQVAAARGNWLILLPGRTRQQDPALREREDLPNLVGPRQTFWSYVWVRSLRPLPQADADVVGGVMRRFRHGFQELGEEVPTIRGGAYAGPQSGTYPATGDAVQALPALACDVTSFGVVSDALARQATFGGTALPASDRVRPTGIAEDRTDYRFAVPNTVGATLEPNLYASGESMRFLGLFYTQVVNSMWGGPSVAAADASFSSGGSLQAFFASFDLGRLAFEAPTRVTPPVSRNVPGSDVEGGTAIYPRFHTYNQFVFYRYVDMSLNDVPPGNSGTYTENPLASFNGDFSWPVVSGHGGGDFEPSAQVEELCAVLTVVDERDGTCRLQSNRDLSLHGTPGAHDTLNPTPMGTPNREVQRFNATPGARFVFGADEGLAETVVLYVSSDGVRDQAGEDPDDNVDEALCAAGLEPLGAFSAGGAPRVVSRHGEDVGPDGAGLAELRDPLRAVASAPLQASWFSARMGRTGEYVNVQYLQDVGTSADFAQALQVQTLQTVRIPRMGSAGVGAAGLGTRFSGPLRVDTDQASLDPAFTGGALRSVPVNASAWQGGVGYRGVQSEPEVMSLLWEQSDGLEDRLFVRGVRVQVQPGGGPSLSLEALGELHRVADVDGFDAIPGNGMSEARFRFLEGTVDLGSVWSGDGGSEGDVLVAYARIVDATTTDGDDFDAAVFCARYDLRDVAEVVEVSRGVDENRRLSVATNDDFSLDDFSAELVGVATVPNDAEFEDEAASAPAAAYVYVLDARSSNGTGLTGLFTRRYDMEARRRTVGAPAGLGEAFAPSAASSGFALPLRVDNPQGGEVDRVQVSQRQRSVLLSFVQGEHVWIQVTRDGLRYRETAGAPNPGLVDNDTSEDVQDYDLTFCVDEHGDAEGGLFWFSKLDSVGRRRLRLRGAVQVQPQ